MDNEIQLISDDDGLAVIGEPEDVEHFLASEGLLSLSEHLVGPRLGPLLRLGAVVAQAGSESAAHHSGRWVKLTKESAQLCKKYGLMESRVPGVSHAMVGKRGSIQSWLQITTEPRPLLGGPALLSSAAGIMAQLALQHEMSQIKRHLAAIGKKVDDVLRAQKDFEWGRVYGAALDIDSALTVLEVQGRVDDDTWSTVQGRTHTITDALGWSLRRLGTLAAKMADTTKIGDLARTAKEVESEFQEALIVLARCSELQAALDKLRLARVLDTSPDELEGRRHALAVDRRRRRERISEEIEHLVACMAAAAGTTRSHVLLHLSAHRAVVGSINRIAIAGDEFQKLLGVEAGRPSWEATRWWDAARDVELLKNAAAEAGRKAAAGVLVAGAVALVASRAALADEESGDAD
ncbi:hypothetical protein OEIGOIKO_00864 [Streptomyces chrestomyceticus JCM 4735]|uniref:Uncharacterized protein n=1 Tax=Streptomyces chrestomyceticus JCM 4735 TaxID=1306181 RepID=A0A7U9PW96_9ACTN|nr:hypothetical protein [Streptomyces chrestomyceticus]GCD33145.1 hypothetical protein OEIGOIKO_00864 [Streptomyces chrestomyceticus JCM 4735]